MISASPQIYGNIPIQQRQDRSAASSLKKSSGLTQNRFFRLPDGPSSAAPAWPVPVVFSSLSERLFDQDTWMVEIEATDAFAVKCHQENEI
jgi:hypothetical protein